MVDKIVYKDISKNRETNELHDVPKVIFGEMVKEDEHFIHIVASDGTRMRVNKSVIITVKENCICSNGNGNGGNYT